MEFNKEQHEINMSISNKESEDRYTLLKAFTKNMILLIFFVIIYSVTMIKCQDSTLFIINGFTNINWYATVIMFVETATLLAVTTHSIFLYDKLKREL